MTFIIYLKDNNLEIDAAVCSGLIFLSGLAAINYTDDNNFKLNSVVISLLMAAALFSKYLLIKKGIKKIFLLGIAAILLMIATLSFFSPLILITFGMLVSLFYKKPFVTINDKDVFICKTLGSRSYDWSLFNNIILKDNLLTLDFETNNILQLEVDSPSIELNEAAINIFCKSQLSK